MHTLLIVDDEPEIADGLYELFDAMDELEIDVCYAYSAREALSILNRRKIDVVLSDIQMPGVNGIELQHMIHKQWPRCKVIFLTGYANFDFAKSAIRNEGTDYILKSEGDEVVISAVKRAIQEIQNEEKNLNRIISFKKELETARPILQNDFFQNLLVKRNISEDILRESFLKLEIPLNADASVLLMLISIKDNETKSEAIDIGDLRLKIQKAIRNNLEIYAKIFSVNISPRQVLFLIQPLNVGNDEKREFGKIFSSIHESLDLIQTNLSQIYNCSISFILASEECSWDAVPEKYEKLHWLLTKSLVYENDIILTEEYLEKLGSCVMSSNEITVRTKMNNMKLLESLIENGMKEKFIYYVNDIFDSIIDQRNISYSLIAEVYYSIALLFLKYINVFKLEDEFSKKFDITKLSKIEQHGSLKNIKDYFTYLAELIFEKRKEEGIENSSRLIIKLHEYIQENLNGDLSLFTLADVVNLNASYLSRIYKKITGKGISEYISEMKIKHAKEMLLDENIKIREIALANGYETSTHFTRFFKKVTGITPQEYRTSIVK